MAEEPKRPVEQELESWAQARRAEAGSPFELDPVRRRQLHEEVARVQVGVVSMPSRPLWWLLLPRLALGGALAGLLMLAVVHMGSRAPSGDTFELARHDQTAVPAVPTEAPKKAERFLAAPVPPAETDDLAPMEVVAQSAVAAPATAKAKTEQPAPTAPGPLPEKLQIRVTQSDAANEQPRSSELQIPVVSETRVAAVRDEAALAPAARAEPPSSVMRSRYGLSTGAVPKGRAGTAALAPAAVSSSDVPKDAGLEARAIARVGEFAPAQRLRRNFNSPPQLVLAQFTLELDGEAVRVVDQDGSVYAGRQVVSGAPADAVATSAPGGLGFAFEVRGTNRATGQSVAFRGVFRDGASSTVRGSAEVGSRTRLEIDAARLQESKRVDGE